MKLLNNLKKRNKKLIMLRKNINLRITITIIAAFFYMHPFAQNWDVPADKKAKNSNVKFDDATTKEGEAIYTKNCVSCHGNPGKGNNMVALNPVPPDLAGAKTQGFTDGELFYIVTTGRVVMPSFKVILSEVDRWKAIAYIRSFNKTYVQVLSKSDDSKSKLVKVNMNFDAKNNIIRVEIKANEKTGIVSLKDAEVLLFVNRYFGKMQIDKTLHTNSEGVAIFNFPKDLPGDKMGNVNLIVKVNDEVYGEIESQNKLKIGVPTDKPSLTEKRAIWNVESKVPIWLIIVYTTCVLFVISIFLFLFYSLFKMKKLGKIKK